jgi:hypothetical protein
MTRKAQQVGTPLLVALVVSVLLLVPFWLLVYRVGILGTALGLASTCVLLGFAWSSVGARRS